MFTERQERLISYWNNVEHWPSLASIAKEFGVGERSINSMAARIRAINPSILIDRHSRYLDRGRKRQGPVVIPELPTGERSIEEIIRTAKAESTRQKQFQEARNVIDLQINHDGPIAIALIPDPHLDNPGTDINAAVRHAELIRDTPGLFCVVIGDWLDNFHAIRPLAAERGEHVLKVSEGYRLQEWFATQIASKLIGAPSGNHDQWSTRSGGDPLGEVLRRLRVSGIYHSDQVRVRLTLPSGLQFTYLMRHEFPGRSIYNASHGVLRWALMDWQGEDVLVGGHTHQAGYQLLERQWMGESRTLHAVQLASYKRIDGYATRIGVRKNMPFVTPAMLHTMDGGTRFISSVEEAADMLDFYKGRQVA